MDVFLTPRRMAVCALLGLAACQAMAQTTVTTATTRLTDSPDAPAYRWRLELSPYTYHFSYNPEHRAVHLAGLERESVADNTFYGLALFSNSFGQDSGYLYLGKSYYNVWESLPQVYVKWSAGILYGYKPPFENKVPLNYKGFSPGFVPAVGWKFGPNWSAQVDMLGTAGFTFSAVKTFN